MKHVYCCNTTMQQALKKTFFSTLKGCGRYELYRITSLYPREKTSATSSLQCRSFIIGFQRACLTTQQSFLSATKPDSIKPLSTPHKILSWNCNSLYSRIVSKSWMDFALYLQSIGTPDVICLQEVRFPAQAPHGAVRNDNAPRNRGHLQDSNPRAAREKDEILRCMTQPPFHNYSFIWSLADWRYAGQLVMVKSGIKILGVRFNICWDADPSLHHKEGRVIVLEFETFVLLATYSCNHGTQMSSFERRREWDEMIEPFVETLHEAYAQACSEGAGASQEYTDRAIDTETGIPLLETCPAKPLIWVGDLNCAPEDCDLSHPDVQRSHDFPLADGTSHSPEFRGQPGCTDVERSRHSSIAGKGRLVDAYRALTPPEDFRKYPNRIGGPFFTWRAHQPPNGGYIRTPVNSFAGTAMRVDLAMIHEDLLAHLKSVQICGDGRSKRDLFFGSDHTPLIVELDWGPPSITTLVAHEKAVAFFENGALHSSRCLP